MNNDVLLIGSPYDTHINAISWGLKQHDIIANTWYLREYPLKQRCSVTIERKEIKQSLVGYSLKPSSLFNNYRTIWLRRLPSSFLDSSIHQADHDFIEGESRSMILGTLMACERLSNSFHINPITSRLISNSKIVQLVLAQQCGLETPESLISNDPQKVRDFFDRNSGHVIFKPFGAPQWITQDGVKTTYTRKLNSEAASNEEAVKIAPGIYQNLIDKLYEVRIVVMGKTFLCSKIEYSGKGIAPDDWRSAQYTPSIAFSKTTVPEQVQLACLRLMKSLNIVFGCFDFAVTAQGRFVFFEVNEAGQFLFLDEMSKSQINTLDPMVNFIKEGSPDFVYKPANNILSLADYYESDDFNNLSKKLNNRSPSEKLIETYTENY